MKLPVLVADHDPDSLGELSERLAQRGFDVIATQDGGDALARFFEREPALIVAHEELPVLGGAQLCQQVKSQDSDTRVLILRGGEIDQGAAEAMRGSTGCDGVLFTPALGGQLESFLDAWELTSEAPASDAPSAPEARADEELFDLGDDDFDGLAIGPGASLGFPALPTDPAAGKPAEAPEAVETPEAAEVPEAPEAPEAPQSAEPAAQPTEPAAQPAESAAAATEASDAANEGEAAAVEPEPVASDPFAMPIPIPVVPTFAASPEPETQAQAPSESEAPAEPEAPAEFEAPAAAEAPAEPEAPAEFAALAEAEAPAEPEAPAEFEAHAEAEAPAEPEAPAEFAAPAAAEAPAEPEAPAEFAAPAAAEAPAEPEAPAEFAALAEAEAPAEPEAPAEFAAPAAAEAPAEPEAPAEFAALAEAEAPAEPEAPAEFEAHAEAEAPAELEAPAQFDAPGVAEAPVTSEAPVESEVPAAPEVAVEPEAPVAPETPPAAAPATTPSVFGALPLTSTPVGPPAGLPPPKPRDPAPQPSASQTAVESAPLAEDAQAPAPGAEAEASAAPAASVETPASSATEAPPEAADPDLPPPLHSLEPPAEEPAPVGVFALPPEDASGRPSNVFGEISSPFSTLEESIADYAEAHPSETTTSAAFAQEPPVQDSAEPIEEPLPELELDDIVETAPASAAPDPVHVMTPSGATRRVSEAKLRESLPEPGVEDLPMGPAGSLGLRGEQDAKLPPGVPSAGDLESMPLPRLIYELYQAAFSGVLTLNNQGDRRRVFIWGGFPVRVETSRASENLSSWLLQNGRLSEEQHAQVEEKIRGDGLRAGDALRALELLSDRELLDAMRALNEERMVNTFAWRQGTYAFEARVDFADGTVFGEVHPLSVIWRGIHDHYDLQLLFDYFSNIRTRYVVTTHAFGVHFAALGPFLRHLNTAEILSGQATFEQALRSDDSRAIELSQLLYFLLVTDMVKPQARPGEPPDELAQAAPAPTSPPQAVDYRELSKVSERIATEYLRLKDVDYFAALGLSHDADADAVERAFNEATVAFRFDRLPPGLGDDMLRKAREIVDMLGQARATLLDESRRESYQQQSKVATVMSFLEDDEDTIPDAHRDTSPLRSNGAASDAEVLYREGQSLLAEGRFKEAQSRIQQALGLEPKVVRYWIGLSQAILLDDSTTAEMSRHGALNCLRRAVEADPGDAAANWEMGKLLAKVGQHAEARQHLQRVLEREPTHSEAQLMLSQL